MKTVPQTPTFAALIRDFFCERLLNQQNVSPHTVAAYRDTIRLLLRFLQRRRQRDVAALTLDDIDAPHILAFLDDLETGRGNTIRTRNARLAAIRALIRYVSSRDPTALPLAQRVLSIPQKRFNRPLLGHLTRPEMEAVLNSFDRTTWSGRRDYALFLLMYNTGARVSEALALRCGDIHPGPVTSICIRGKGRKERTVPLWKTTAVVLKQWLAGGDATEQAPLFPNRHGRPLTRSGVEDRLQRAVSAAVNRCPSLRGKQISPHTFRHTTAMHLLQAGVDITVIALWLGHESSDTTHQYVEADMQMKKRVLDRIEVPVKTKQPRIEASGLLDFLDRM